MKYPRVLVVAIGRINAADTANNGLLLRNLFGAWPRENLAQIYSSGDNGDDGFFGHYYRLGPQDRRIGRMFYKLKTEMQKETAIGSSVSASSVITPDKVASIKSLGKRLLVDTGLYELIFRPRISHEMLVWVRDFRPDIIFTQGYNLTFTWLPLILKRETGAKLAFLTTDDWPTYLYSGQLGEPSFFGFLMKSIVKKATFQLLSAVDVPFAFGKPMADEYSNRYGKMFITLSHADDPRRFEEAAPLRVHAPNIFNILAVGTFNRFRWPLLLDANDCCQMLKEQGIHARITVMSSGIDLEGERKLAQAAYIDILEDPGNDLLPCYLKGADVLLLAEGFDEGFVSAIRLSVSSKAHLFMFSHRPIIVYAHPDTGLCKYASTYRWARVVPARNIQMLLGVIRDLLTDENEARLLTSRAYETGKAFHLRDANQARFLNSLMSHVCGRE